MEMDNVRQDLRYAVRTLLRSPGFAVVAVLTLALGIGANTAIFSVVRGVLLRPLGYEAPDRLVRLFETFLPGGRGQGSVSVPNLRDWREQSRAFEQFAAYSYRSLNLQGVDDPERLSAVAATANVFDLLGAVPRLGRAFVSGEDEPGAPRVVVLSDGLWRRRFGADPGLIGQTITLDSAAYTVVGIMPAGFRFPAGSTGPDLWVPLQFTPTQAENRGSHWLRVIGRLRPGATLASAQAEMSEIAARLAEQYPEQQAGRDVRLFQLRDVVVGNARPGLLVLLGAAGLVLLIACANTANLLLARSATRGREVAVRAALGAGRGRLLRQFLTESVLLGLLGGAVGLLLARLGVAGLIALAGAQLPRAAEIRFDAGVFAFLLSAVVLTGLGFGLVPALRASRASPHDDLKEGGRQGSFGRRGRRFRGALVAGEVALSLVLLLGAGLLMKTFLALQDADTGMATENVLTMNISVPADEYPEGAAFTAFYRPLLERVRALPGVRAAGAVSHLPLQSWGFNGRFTIEGRPTVERMDRPFAEFRVASRGYLRALGIPVVRGRGFLEEDDTDAPLVALINETLAGRYFQGEDPIGQRVDFGFESVITIVGVVGDVRESRLDREPAPTMYGAHAQSPGRTGMTLVVSTAVPPTGLTGAVRDAVRSLDPDQAIYNVQTMERVVAESVSDRRLYLWLMGIFAAIALALAAAGIYGVISYAVAQRTRELGIRMALGARTDSVLRLVLRQGGTLAGLGLAIGLPLALALTRVLSSLLYGVSATDPGIFAGVSLVLAAVALLATYIPARRATRVDPIIALRHE